MGIPCCVVIWATWSGFQGKRSTFILSYFKTLSGCPVLGIEPLTSCFAVKLCTNWVNFVVLKSHLILLMISCLSYSTVRQGWVDCPSCISVHSTGIMFICDGCGTRQKLDSIYIWMAKKVLWEKSLRFLAFQMTGHVKNYYLSCLDRWFLGPQVTLQDCLSAFFSSDELKGTSYSIMKR